MPHQGVSIGPRGGPNEYACPVCDDRHEATARVDGWPILVCPKLSGSTVHFEPGWTVLVAGTDRK